MFPVRCVTYVPGLYRAMPNERLERAGVEGFSSTRIAVAAGRSAAGRETCGSTMKPRISVLMLGVADLEQSLEFYRDGLGLPTEGMPYKVVHGASDVAVGQRGYS